MKRIVYGKVKFNNDKYFIVKINIPLADFNNFNDKNFCMLGIMDQETYIINVVESYKNKNKNKNKDNICVNIMNEPYVFIISYNDTDPDFLYRSKFIIATHFSLKTKFKIQKLYYEQYISQFKLIQIPNIFTNQSTINLFYLNYVVKINDNKIMEMNHPIIVNDPKLIMNNKGNFFICTNYTNSIYFDECDICDYMYAPNYQKESTLIFYLNHGFNLLIANTHQKRLYLPFDEFFNDYTNDCDDNIDKLIDVLINNKTINVSFTKWFSSYCINLIPNFIQMCKNYISVNGGTIINKNNNDIYDQSYYVYNSTWFLINLFKS